MLVGKQENFALEYTFDEFFDQTFIASGRFIVYINGFSYGRTESDAVTFGVIYSELLKILELSKVNQHKNICLTSGKIADFYYDKYFREERKFSKNELQYFSCLLDNNIIYEWSLDAALDNGSMVIQLKEKNFVRLIGFMPEGEKIKQLHSISISILEFQNIINSVLSELKQIKEKLPPITSYGGMGEIRTCI